MSKHLTSTGAIWVGLILVGLTLISVYVHDSEVGGSAWLLPLLFLVAGIKARIVILHFMDIRNAEKSWRIAFEAWVIVTTVATVSLSALPVF